MTAYHWDKTLHINPHGITRERVQAAMRKNNIYTAEDLSEKLTCSTVLCSDVYGASDYIGFLSVSKPKKTHCIPLISFNAINWYLAEYTNVPPIITSEHGLRGMISHRHTRNIGKVLLCLDLQDQKRFTDAYLELGRRIEFKILRSIYDNFRHDTPSDMQYFAEFCMRNHSLIVHPYDSFWEERFSYPDDR